jgi:hypothetical protein
VIFGVLVHLPDVVDARAGLDVFHRQHRGHHRVILIVVTVHPVAPHHMQRGETRLQIIAHGGDMGGIALVIDRIGLFLTHHRAADHLIGADQTRISISRVARAISSSSLCDHKPSPSKQKYSRPTQATSSCGTISGDQLRKFWMRPTCTLESWI